MINKITTSPTWNLQNSIFRTGEHSRGIFIFNILILLFLYNRSNFIFTSSIKILDTVASREQQTRLQVQSRHVVSRWSLVVVGVLRPRVPVVLVGRLLVAPGRRVGLRVRLVVGLRRGGRRLVVRGRAARHGGGARRARRARRALLLLRVRRRSANVTNHSINLRPLSMLYLQ